MTQIMNRTKISSFLLCSAVCLSFVPDLTYARSAKPISAEERKYVQAVAQSCVGDWEKKTCLTTLAKVNKHIASYYAESLHKSGKKKRLEPLKQACAASTAAQTEDVPAYAMKSAMTECANKIADISSATNITPNINLYQLMIAGVLCLGQDAQCASLEARLQALAHQ